MIHYGKAPNEDKVIIEVSDDDLLHLKNVLMAMPLPERRVFYGIKELLETDQALRKYIDPQMQKVATEREQNDACISFAEREQARRSNGKGGTNDGKSE